MGQNITQPCYISLGDFRMCLLKLRRHTTGCFPEDFELAFNSRTKHEILFIIRIEDAVKKATNQARRFTHVP